MLQRNTEQLETTIHEKLPWAEWREYPRNLPHCSVVDLKGYDGILTEMSSTIFCEDDNSTEISVVDVMSMKFNCNKTIFNFVALEAYIN